MKKVTIIWADGSVVVIPNVKRVEDGGPWLILTTDDGQQRWVSAANCAVVNIEEPSSGQP